MASPAVALPNGVPEPAHSRDIDMTDAQPISPIKRKREPSINGTALDDAKPQPTTNGDAHPSKTSEAAIRQFLLVLERYVCIYMCSSLRERSASNNLVAAHVLTAHLLVQIRCNPFRTEAPSSRRVRVFR